MNEEIKPLAYDEWLMKAIRRNTEASSLDLSVAYVDYVKTIARIVKDIKGIESDVNNAGWKVRDLENDAEMASFTYPTLQNQDEVA